MRPLLILLTTVFLSGCMGMPDKVQPVDNFELQRYLGTWYEVARLDHSFERGLEQVTAEYTLQDNGTVEVRNRGFDTNEGEWKEAVGKAKLAAEPNQGYLKVSFFGPFYSSYVIFELGKDYDYAFVSGFNNDYLWLLSRTPTIDDALKQRFLSEAASKGFNTDELIFVDQQNRDDAELSGH
ncbi:apolipoprotein D and lipocalin family protein [Litorivivens lipolytica]|uniref:Outer membrane lipoprotein Blc n=1 Tax=Litorivivens lipolytica TaxID=1524264 RepID=A0A7W4W4L0_9GAMM|nr:lipocalin family protein [Litorivivens lipolytica]MBB3047361.1 apolipoprotein D and lipocalin family protein [Litorivivens lipolytica]